MKKLIIIILYSLIFISCSQNEKIVPDSQRLIKSNLFSYKYSFGIPDTSGIIKETILFNRKGKDSIKTIFDENGIEKSKTHLSYDTLYNLIQSLTYDNSGKVIKKITYTHDKYGRILSSKEDNSDDSYSYKTFVYDNNKLIRENWESKSYFKYLSRWDISKYVVQMNYDLNDSLVSEKYFENNKLSWTYTYKYDSLGKKIETNYAGNTRMYLYDSTDNIAEEISLSENGKQAFRWVRKYNSENIIVEEIKYNSLNEPIELEKRIFYYK